MPPCSTTSSTADTAGTSTSTTCPSPPRWLRPFARFDAGDHLAGTADDTLRRRVESFLTEQGVPLPGGRITALMQARVLGYVFNPLSLFWCHDADGVLRAVIAEVHNTYGQQPRVPVATETPATAW